MRCFRPPYSFEISLTPNSKISPGLQRKVASAAKATLLQIPVKVLKAKLKIRGRFALSLSTIGPTRMREMNGVFRRKDRPTDVLSFSRLEGMRMPSPDIGDVLLCPSVARHQAKRLGITLEEELQRLTVHGVLHLFGFDHEKSKAEAKRMFQLQDAILSTLGWPLSD